jgi:hypothetical protein
VFIGHCDEIKIYNLINSREERKKKSFNFELCGSFHFKFFKQIESKRDQNKTCNGWMKRNQNHIIELEKKKKVSKCKKKLVFYLVCRGRGLRVGVWGKTFQVARPELWAFSFYRLIVFSQTWVTKFSYNDCAEYGINHTDFFSP